MLGGGIKLGADGVGGAVSFVGGALIDDGADGIGAATGRAIGDDAGAGQGGGNASAAGSACLPSSQGPTIQRPPA